MGSSRVSGHHSPPQEERDVDERGEVCEELEDEDLYGEVVLTLGEGPWFLCRQKQGFGHTVVGPCPAPPGSHGSLGGCKGVSVPCGALPAPSPEPFEGGKPRLEERSLRATSWGRRGLQVGRKTML